jgi:hypothetical protein
LGRNRKKQEEQGRNGNKKEELGTNRKQWREKN